MENKNDPAIISQEADFYLNRSDINQIYKNIRLRAESFYKNLDGSKPYLKEKKNNLLESFFEMNFAEYKNDQNKFCFHLYKQLEILAEIYIENSITIEKIKKDLSTESEIIIKDKDGKEIPLELQFFTPETIEKNYKDGFSKLNLKYVPFSSKFNMIYYYQNPENPNEQSKNYKGEYDFKRNKGPLSFFVTSDISNRRNFISHGLAESDKELIEKIKKKDDYILNKKNTYFAYIDYYKLLTEMVRLVDKIK